MQKDSLLRLLVLYAILLGLVEVGLQLRAEYRFGNSIFSKLLSGRGEGEKSGMFVTDPHNGLMTLRPSSKFDSRLSSITTNSIGLRSPEIPPNKEWNEYRFAVLGASTVMGAFARENTDTFSYLAAELLSTSHPERTISFINAGISGLYIDEQYLLYDVAVRPFRPDVLVLHTGMMDLVRLCREPATDSTSADRALWRLELPKWLKTYELITKNTLWADADELDTVSGEEISLLAYRYADSVRRIVTEAKRNGTDIVILGNAKAFRPVMPLKEQTNLSNLMSYYYSCLDLQGFYASYDAINSRLRQIAATENVIYLETEDFVPGGREYFADSVHYNKEGEILVARLLADALTTHISSVIAQAER